MRQTRRTVLAALALVVALATASVGALTIADDLGRVTGYVVVGRETIEDFTGCESGKIIQFVLGGHVTCQEYGYAYGFWETAIILARPTRRGFVCAMVVEDTVYDIECSSYVRRIIDLYRSLASSTNADHAAFARHMLRALGEEQRRTQPR